MKWYYKVQGGHTHVRVFMNGAKCGDLCFRNEEFEEIKRAGEAVSTLSSAVNGYPIMHFIHDLKS